jgi:hypothetical protein
VSDAALKQKNLLMAFSKTYNLAKEIVMADKLLGSFSIFVLPQNILQYQTELITYEAISIKIL